MRAMRALRPVFFLGLLSSLLVPRPVDGAPAAERAWSWDPLATQVLSAVASQIDDFGSIVRAAASASCTVSVSITSNASPLPMTGRLSYEWEDKDDSGTIGFDEVRATVEAASAPAMQLLTQEIKNQLEIQTVSSMASVFFLHDVTAKEGGGGYDLTLKPIGSRVDRDRFGYRQAVLRVDREFRPTSLRASALDGSEVSVTPKYKKRGARLLFSGYDRVIAGSAARIEESRTDEYAEVDGLFVLDRATVQSRILTLAGVIISRQEYAFSNWKIEKRKPRPETKVVEPAKKEPEKEAPAKKDEREKEPEKKEEVATKGEAKTEPGFIPAAEIAPPEGGDAMLAAKVLEKLETEYVAPAAQGAIFSAVFSLAGPDGKLLDRLHCDLVSEPYAPTENRPKTDDPAREKASEAACDWIRLAVRSPIESVHEESRQRRFKAWQREDGYELFEGEKWKYFYRILVTKDHEIKRREGWSKIVDVRGAVVVHEYETGMDGDAKVFRRVVERHLDEETGAVLLERTARFEYDETLDDKPFLSAIVFTFDGREYTVRIDSLD